MTYAEELRFRQNRFATHVSWLISFLQSNESGLTISLGEVERTKLQQEVYVMEGLSKTQDSMHLKRLAIDINFFNGDYRLFSDPAKRYEDFKAVELAGEYWEDLHPQNKWGGRWDDPFDPCHFEHSFR